MDQLLKIYQVAQKLKLNSYMQPIKDKLLVMAKNNEQFEKMQMAAKKFELDELMESIKKTALNDQ